MRHVLTKNELKMVKTGLDRQERVVQTCQNIRILRHSLSQPVFSMFFTPFSLCFWHVYNRSRVCQNTVEGLFKGLSKPFKAVFVLFPSKLLFTDGQFGRSLVQHHQKIPLQHSFCSCKWKDTVANQFCNTLAHCAAVQHMGHARKT